MGKICSKKGTLVTDAVDSLKDVVRGHALLHFTKFSNLSSMAKSRVFFLLLFPNLVTCNDLEEVVILTFSQSLFLPTYNI